MFGKYSINGVELHGIHRIFEIGKNAIFMYSFYIPLIPTCLTFQMCYINKKDLSKMFICSFIPIIFVLLSGIYSSIFGIAFITSTIYGFDGFYLGIFFALMFSSPILLACLIFQIKLFKKIKKEYSIDSSKNNDEILSSAEAQKNIKKKVLIEYLCIFILFLIIYVFVDRILSYYMFQNANPLDELDLIKFKIPIIIGYINFIFILVFCLINPIRILVSSKEQFKKILPKLIRYIYIFITAFPIIISLFYLLIFVSVYVKFI